MGEVPEGQDRLVWRCFFIGLAGIVIGLVIMLGGAIATSGEEHDVPPQAPVQQSAPSVTKSP